MNFLPILRILHRRHYREQNKAFFIDEVWVFLKDASIRSYIVEGLKTLGKAQRCPRALDPIAR
jgi:hypothetical protein